MVLAWRRGLVLGFRVPGLQGLGFWGLGLGMHGLLGYHLKPHCKTSRSVLPQGLGFRVYMGVSYM